MKKEITIDDLPLGVQRQMRDSIRKDSAFMELSGAWAELIKTGQFARAAILKKKMDQIEDETLRLYIKEYVHSTSEPMMNLLKEMNVDDVEQWNVNVNAIILLCDMIETLVSECNQTLHKYHPDFRLEMFDRLGELGEVHEQLHHHDVSDQLWRCIGRHLRTGNEQVPCLLPSHDPAEQGESGTGKQGGGMSWGIDFTADIFLPRQDYYADIS